MSPIYRSEAVQFAFSGEAGPGGYMDNVTGTDSETGAGVLDDTTLSPPTPGYRVIGTSLIAGYTADEYVQIGTGATAEVRRITRVVADGDATGHLHLDFPLGFYHAAGEALNEVSAAFSGDSFTTFFPGVYQTITTPDITPEILPQYLLGTSSNRNWYVAYKGKESFAGGLPNFVLLNGYPLRFPFGTVTTTGTDSGTGGSTLSAAAYKGQCSIAVTDGTGYSNGDYVQIGNAAATNAEVRQIISGASGAGAQTFVLNYPLMLAHNSTLGAGWDTLNEVTSPYTHTIFETQALDSMTWFLQMRDSGGTTANDLIRKWMGGYLNRATIAADEGALLSMSWDDAQFLDMAHNQRYHPSVAGDIEIVRYNGALLRPDGIGGAIPEDTDALGTPTYPTTQPYYFSQGTLSLFGNTFARVRNFRLEINNNIQPRYYIRDNTTQRGPAEIQEQRREYRMTVTIAMPDSFAASEASSALATRSLFKELLLQGEYTTGSVQGFDMSLTFTRGSNDTITITSPPSAATTGGDAQGCFFVRAPHNIAQESPVQVDGEILMRSVRIVAVDSIPVYP